MITIRQSSDKTIRIRQPGSCNNFLICGIQFSITDILHNGSSTQISILKNDTHGTSQITLFDLIYIDAIITDLTILNIIETIQKIGNCRLTGTRGADKCNFLSWLRIHLHIVKHDLVITISEVNAIQNNITFQFDIICFASGFVKMLPCPASCTFLGLNQLTILFFHIYQGHISVIYLRLLVQKVEDTLRSGKCHNNTVKLLAYLIDRLAEALVKSKKTCQAAKSKSTHTIYCQHAANNGTQHIADIPNLCTGRHQHVCKFIGIIRALKQLVIQLIKLLKAFFLMAEYLYNLLAFHHFLDVTIYNTKILLLLHEILAAESCKIFTCHQHHSNHDQSHDGKRHIQNNHTYQYTDNGNHTGNQLWNTLADHLAQCINIIGVDRHDIAMCMCIKIFNRKCFHALKHLISKIA